MYVEGYENWNSVSYALTYSGTQKGWAHVIPIKPGQLMLSVDENSSTDSRKVTLNFTGSTGNGKVEVTQGGAPPPSKDPFIQASASDEVPIPSDVLNSFTVIPPTSMTVSYEARTIAILTGGYGSYWDEVKTEKYTGSSAFAIRKPVNGPYIYLDVEANTDFGNEKTGCVKITFGSRVFYFNFTQTKKTPPVYTITTGKRVDLPMPEFEGLPAGNPNNWLWYNSLNANKLRDTSKAYVTGRIMYALNPGTTTILLKKSSEIAEANWQPFIIKVEGATEPVFGWVGMEQAIKDYDQKPTHNNGKGKSAFVQYAKDQKNYHGGRYMPANGSIPAYVDFAYNENGYMPGHAGEKVYATMWTKYGVNEGLGTDGSKNWCAIFVLWCANKADVSGSITRSYSALAMVNDGTDNYHENNGDYVPEAGDLFLLKASPYHVGIVADVYVINSQLTDTNTLRILTIEGNHNNAVGSRTIDIAFNGYATGNCIGFNHWK